MGWRKSSRCNSVGCIEVRRNESQILIRDSKEPDLAPLRYNTEEWAAFVAGVKAGEFDDLLDQSIMPGLP